MRKALRRRGFTLVELMVIVALIAVLAAIALPSFNFSQKKGIAGSIPRFPWPPPQASGTVTIPKNLLVGKGARKFTLGDIQARLESALDRAGYSEKSYFAVPQGFVVVTRLEQFSDNGVPKPGSERWNLEVGPLKQFSLGEYLAALFNARAGHFRVIAFVVTPLAFSQSDAAVSREEATLWFGRGANKLPPELAAKEFTAQHYCTALIYEFSKAGPGTEAALKVPGTLPAREQLVKANVWQALEKN